MKMFIIYSAVMSLITIYFVIKGIRIMISLNKKLKNQKKKEKFKSDSVHRIHINKYLITRKTDSLTKKRERQIMESLKNGEIKCHLLKNTSEEYEVGQWVSDMRYFMKKPIFKQILSMKGHDL